MSFDLSKLKLGALLGSRRDPRTLKLARYFRRPSVLVPDDVDWDLEALKAEAYRMWSNDRMGNCVFAAFYNLLAGITAQTGDPFSAVDQDVIGDYAEVTGYDPETGENDNGTIPEDALRYYSKKCMADQTRILAWAEVDPDDLELIQEALYVFGGIYTAFYLPKSAQDQTGDGKIWDVPRLWTPKSIAGTWGGHMTVTRHIDFTADPGKFYTVTWGKVQEMTEAFWKKYCASAYVLVTEKWVSDMKGVTPTGFNLARLIDDAEALRNS